MPTTSNFGWTTPADTDLVKDGAAAIRTLGNGIDTSFLDLKGGTSGQVLSKNSNADLDYTWVTPNVGDITEVQAGTGISVASGTGPIPVITNTVATTFDAAGDLVYGTGADTFTKLSLGTAGKVLTVNSGATAPEWATPSGGDWVKLGSSGTNGGTELVNTANFSSTYRFYYLAINRLSFTGGNLLFQFYTGGSPVTSAYYGNSFGYTAAGALVTNNNNNSGSFTLATTSASGERSAGYMYICRRADSGTPFNSFYGQLITESSAGAIRALSLSGIQDSNTNYDGIRFSPSAGTFIMEFTIYGLKA